MEPVRPDYAGACVAGLVRGLRGAESWVPDAVRDASAVVLLVVDGLGWEIVERHRERMPTLSTLVGGPITTVVPSTTTTALTSLTTGLTPAEHGIVGYRLLVGGEVMNVLRWSMTSDRRPPEPADFQPRLAFNGEPIPVVTRAEFGATGFTAAHLRGARFCGWHGVSSIAVHCRGLIDEGERFVYAYYGNADVVFHMHGLEDGFLVAELAFVDRLIGDLLDALPPSVAVVVSADHGHVAFERWIETTPLEGLLAARSGEARFRYLHARRGAERELAAAAEELYAQDAWILPKDRVVDEGWLGPQAMTPQVRHRIGDVVLAAHEPVGFLDPANPGEQRLRSGHGSLTPGEMLVPLLSARGRA